MMVSIYLIKSHCSLFYLLYHAVVSVFRFPIDEELEDNKCDVIYIKYI